MTRAITLHNVSKAYGRSPRAVDRLSLSIDPGEFVVLLGPSGCGKSTVLRMIAGLEDTTEGEVLLDGEPANHLTPRERGMAMVFQNFALYPTMTNRANIGFPLKLENPRQDHNERIENTARMLGIERILDRLPGQLSGGERQRVAMGRAISRQPSAFLMDEPLSNLDAKLRNHLRAEIAQLTKELGVTTVYVTHDQAEAMSLGHRVAVMRGGVLQQVSPPREVYALPENVFVAAFIGTPRINLLQAVVHAPLEGRMSIDLGRQRLPLPEPLSPDHQLLRIQQGRPVIVGLRSEAVRIAPPSQARPGRSRSAGSSSTSSTRATRRWSTSTPAHGPPWSRSWNRPAPTGAPCAGGAAARAVRGYWSGSRSAPPRTSAAPSPCWRRRRRTICRPACTARTAPPSPPATSSCGPGPT